MEKFPSKTVILKNMGTSDKKRIPEYESTNVACTLLQRDYKGANNYGFNGVIEKWEL